MRDLWQRQVSRTYSAFTRLTSLAQYHDSEEPVTLAELGLLNYEDGNKKLRHYMDYSVPIESIYENKEEDGSTMKNLQIGLQKQMPANYLLKGLRTWNVSLAQTINALPPSTQRDMTPSDMKPTNAAIDSVKTASKSSFVMTGSRESASINVWSSKLGLNFAGGYNFRNQYYKQVRSAEGDPVQKLYFDSMVKVHDEEDASVYVSKAIAHKYKANGVGGPQDIVLPSADSDEVGSSPQIDEKMPNSPTLQQTDSQDPFGGFALDALFDETNHVEHVFAQQSSDSESECEDEDGYGILA